MKKQLLLLTVLSLMVSSVAWAQDKVVLYSGRDEKIIGPVISAFEAKTGIEVQILYAGSSELLTRLKIEGDRSPSDVFLTNNAVMLELAREEGLFQEIEEAWMETIPAEFK